VANAIKSFLRRDFVVDLQLYLPNEDFGTNFLEVINDQSKLQDIWFESNASEHGSLIDQYLDQYLDQDRGTDGGATRRQVVDNFVDFGVAFTWNMSKVNFRSGTAMPNMRKGTDDPRVKRIFQTITKFAEAHPPNFVSNLRVDQSRLGFHSYLVVILGGY
jgi:hypothetical protein